MGHVVFAVVFGIGTPLVVFPFALLAWTSGGPARWFAVAIGVLSLGVLPGYLFLLHWIADVHNLTFKP
jgi:hypothetical protein